jgi:hypothetical protein
MTELEPDFYLASSEGYGLDRPRACYCIRRLHGATRDDYLLARLEPPLSGQPYGLGDRAITNVVIATRHVGASLFPIAEWPVAVHVARPLVADAERLELIADGDLEEIGWAELYPSRAAAENKSA